MLTLVAITAEAIAYVAVFVAIIISEVVTWRHISERLTGGREPQLNVTQ